MLELMKRVFSVTFMIAILVTMAVVTTVAHMPDAEAFQKGQGVYNSKHGSATKGIVCGDRLCSEIGQVKSSDVSAMKTKSPQHTPMSIGAISVDSVTGATIKDTMIDKQSEAVIVSIDAHDDGKIMLNLPSTVSDVFMVIVDGEEWDDAYIDENEVKIYFYAGAEKIEIIGNVLG